MRASSTAAGCRTAPATTLGLDVHDCAQAKRELYLDGVLPKAWSSPSNRACTSRTRTCAIPAEYRGIGVRIEDDILMTADGPVNLSAALPRKADDVESWMAGIYREADGEGSQHSPA